MNPTAPASSHFAPLDLHEAQQARDAARLFASVATNPRRSQTLSILPDNKASQPVEVPETAFRLFLEVLNQMAQGNAVTLVPTHHELTTQQAANLLRVSRPYFVKLLESQAIPHHRVGCRRRVRFADLMDYLEKMKGPSRKALDQLAAQAQELNMGY